MFIGFPYGRVLEPHSRLKLINPYFIKQLPGHKSDVKDAQWITECMLKELVCGSFVPPERIQQLRQYDRRIYDLDDEIVRKLSKLDAAVQRFMQHTAQQLRLEYGQQEL